MRQDADGDRLETYYLEMRSPDSLHAGAPVSDLRIDECRVKQYAFNRFLYTYVGESWSWLDKLGWSEQQWRDYAEADNLRTWVAWAAGTPAGYYELQQQAGGDVEIAYFGLATWAIGRGYGGHLLTHALRSAWEWPGTQRVWVHTCSLDHPNALGNYRRRGMQVYRVDRETHAGEA